MAEYTYNRQNLKTFQNNFMADLFNFNKKDLSVYQNNIISNLTSCLIDIYPVFKRLVGEQCFNYLVFDYIKLNKPNSYNLNYYGDKFYNYILSHDISNDLPYLSDIAKLEWYINLSYLKSNYLINKKNNNLDFNLLKSSSKFKLKNNIFLLKSIYPIDKIWQQNQNNIVNPKTIILTKNTRYFIIFYKNDNLYINKIIKIQYEMLNLINKNLNFEDICYNLNKLKFKSDDIINCLSQIISYLEISS